MLTVEQSEIEHFFLLLIYNEKSQNMSLLHLNL